MNRLTYRFFLLSLAFLFLCGGCAAVNIALEKKDLVIDTKMSDTIFLDIINQKERTIFVDMKNTSDKDADIKALITGKLIAKGYVAVDNPQKAFYIFQGNILYIGQSDPSAIRKSLYAGYGGVWAGAAAGVIVGNVANSYTGALYGLGIGGIVGGAADLVAGSLVKDVTFTIITDLMITERSGSGKVYKTRVVSSANQVNLKLEEAMPLMVDGLARSIAGIF